MVLQIFKKNLATPSFELISAKHYEDINNLGRMQAITYLSDLSVILLDFEFFLTQDHMSWK